MAGLRVTVFCAENLGGTRAGSLQASWLGDPEICHSLGFTPPEALHDYESLGREKRERERVRRRRRNWREGLKRMPELERQAVLAEILRAGGDV